MSIDQRRISRALLSVSDKTGLVEFAQTLVGFGVELISTGGTRKALAEAGLPVRDIADLTHFPEMMDGRVKTLHPKVHGGLLAIRENPEHEAAMLAHDIHPIDLLVVNLYPFEATLMRGASFDECVENIDVGGPAMIRGASKNHEDVAVVVDTSDYKQLITEMMETGGATRLITRRRLAQKAYARTAAYDAAISNWLSRQLEQENPPVRAFAGYLEQAMRYGENPHQLAGFYRSGEQRLGVASARQLQGKQLSYNNVNDTNAAFECVAEFDPSLTAAVAIVKHANPCGVAEGSTLLEAYQHALMCDPVSAFGGIVALNRKIDAVTAREIVKIFTEVIIAPDAEQEAIDIIGEKKNLRLLVTGGLPDPRACGHIISSVAGGFLVQTRDCAVVDDMSLSIVTRRSPDMRELADLKFAYRVAKHVKSNAIVYAKNCATVGIGAGQMSRVDASRIAAHKAMEAAEAAGLTTSFAQGAVVASDAFFPFADGLLAAAAAGATAVIQPGGSINDKDVIAAADAHGLAMIFTGVRHFRH